EPGQPPLTSPAAADHGGLQDKPFPVARRPQVPFPCCPVFVRDRGFRRDRLFLRRLGIGGRPQGFIPWTRPERLVVPNFPRFARFRNLPERQILGEAFSRKALGLTSQEGQEGAPRGIGATRAIGEVRRYFGPAQSCFQRG